ncbi:MAG: ribonuclease Z [archaeon]
MNITFLGTSSSAPTKNRNLSGTIVSFKGKNYLFDCGEGTQQQLMKAKVSYMKINEVFLSHLHGDHVFGLPGLLASMNLHKRDFTLTIFGPKGTKNLMKTISKLNERKLLFEVIVKEVEKSGKVFEDENVLVKAFKVNHTVTCFGYKLEEVIKTKGKFLREKAIALGVEPGPLFKKLHEGKSVKVKGKTIKPSQVLDFSKAKKGKSVSYVVDSIVKGNYLNAVKGSSVLVHEACFTEKHAGRARDTKHSTAKMAAKLARKAKVGKLFLTHFSNRYKKLDELLNEAKKEFNESHLAKDLMEVKVE